LLRPSAILLLQTDLEASAQALKATEIVLLNIGGDRICRRAVVSVTGEIAVLNHQHPRLTVLNQLEPEGFSQRVAGSEQAFFALATQQITKRVPSQFKGVLEGFDQTLLLPLIQRRRLKKSSSCFKTFV